MGRETHALMTGVFVVVLLSAALGAAYWLGGYDVVRDTYLVTTQGAVSGLKPESTVFYRGVEAGKVGAVGFDPEDVRNILIRIEVDRNLPITRGTYAMLRSQPLTGLAQIELYDAGENPEPLPTRADRPSRIPMRPSLLDKLTDSGQDILLQVRELMTNLNGLLNGQNHERIEHIMVTVEAAAGRFTTLEERIDRTLAELPALTAEARRTLSAINGLTRDFKTEAKTLAEAARGMMASGKVAADTLPQVNGLLQDLRPTVKHVRRLSGLLEKDPQVLLLGPRSYSPGPAEPGYEESR